MRITVLFFLRRSSRRPILVEITGVIESYLGRVLVLYYFFL